MRTPAPSGKAEGSRVPPDQERVSRVACRLLSLPIPYKTW